MPSPLTTIRSLVSTKMLRKIRQAAGILLLLLFALLAVDFVQAHLRLARVSIEGQFDKDKVIANGEDSIILTLRVTENGRPRVNGHFAGLVAARQRPHDSGVVLYRRKRRSPDNFFP